ncbi:MBL fold metallo-hydrolase [Tolumonas lignilytica]|uniref:MBL fold metallo-hydrolase n=1 Tax=Tolumonas lignilytica TaxID=1283284 RepID=UPI00046464F0|nr:MBL fold metallo-hydrolase [Tolumonas lignilytica]
MSCRFELTVICDNQAEDDLLSEHGLSFRIRADGHLILFDTGSGETLLPNAAKLKVDLTELSHLILSHGHYDHTGGVAQILAANKHCSVIAHPCVLSERYSRHAERPVKRIGMPVAAQAALQQLDSVQLHCSAAVSFISDNIGITGFVPRTHTFEDTGGPFYLDEAGLYADLIPDDQALWINTPQGIVIILGCCHSGLLNTVEYIRQLNEGARIAGIIGGLHLLHASSERLEQSVTYLKKLRPQFIYAGHCTGDDVIVMLRENLRETAVGQFRAGMRIGTE